MRFKGIISININLGMFLSVFKWVSRKFQEGSNEDFRVFQESFKVVSRGIKGIFFGVLSGVQRCLKQFQWVFEASFTGVSRKFQGCFKKPSTEFLGRLGSLSRDL